MHHLYFATTELNPSDSLLPRKEQVNRAIEKVTADLEAAGFLYAENAEEDDIGFRLDRGDHYTIGGRWADLFITLFHEREYSLIAKEIENVINAYGSKNRNHINEYDAFRSVLFNKETIAFPGRLTRSAVARKADEDITRIIHHHLPQFAENIDAKTALGIISPYGVFDEKTDKALSYHLMATATMTPQRIQLLKDRCGTAQPYYDGKEQEELTLEYLDEDTQGEIIIIDYHT